MSFGAGVAASALANVGTEPFLPGQADAKIIETLTQIAQLLTAQNAYADEERQRTLYPYNIGPGQTVRLDGGFRLHSLLVSGVPGDELALRIGTADVFSWWMVTGDAVVIEVPMLLTNGADLVVRDITTPADTTWRAYLWAHHDRGIGRG